MLVRRLGVGLTLLLAAWGCASGAKPPPRAFEPRYFTGLTAKHVATEDDARLDIDFDKVGGGLLRFGHCREVKPELLAQVVPSQDTLAEILRLNCLAVHRYANSQPASRNHMPARWSRDGVAKLPAEVLPELGPDDATTPTLSHPRITLARRPGARHISPVSDGYFRVNGTEVRALFCRLAQADFNGDGYQDWLLRMNWGAQHGSMKGSQLLLVTRLSAGGPLRVLERIGR